MKCTLGGASGRPNSARQVWPLHRPGVGPGAGGDHVARLQVGGARAVAQCREEVGQRMQGPSSTLLPMPLLDAFAVAQQRDTVGRELRLERGGASGQRSGRNAAADQQPAMQAAIGDRVGRR